MVLPARLRTQRLSEKPVTRLSRVEPSLQKLDFGESSYGEEQLFGQALTVGGVCYSDVPGVGAAVEFGTSGVGFPASLAGRSETSTSGKPSGLSAVGSG